MKRGLSRRNLFKYMGMGGATTAVAACEGKPEKLIPLLVSPDEFEYTPHTSYQYMTTCQECSGGCGMMVTAREGRAQKAEGNPNHPMNQGALCARGQAAMQTLYNPERIQAPKDKEGKQLTWDEAEKLFANQLKAANGQIAYLGKPTTGSDDRFIDQWLGAVGGGVPPRGKRVRFQAVSDANFKKANEMAFGRFDIPTYKFDEAKYLLNFSTDFMETWGNSVENTRQFTKMHAYQNQHKNKFVHVGPHISLTGANADEWVMIKPGSEGIMALAIAHEVNNAKNSFGFLKAYLANYAPDKVSDKIGTTVDTIKKIAKEFSENTPSLAVGGGHLVASEHGTDTLLAINILNAVAGNIGKTVAFLSQNQSESYSHQEIFQLVEDLKANKVKVLIVDDVNPLYALPKSSGIEDALKNTFVISLASTKNETTNVADLILPTLTPYESWGDSFPRSGIRNISQPVMASVNVFDARAKENILLAVNKMLETGQFTDIASYVDYLKKAWKGIQLEIGSTGPFDAFWISTLENGGVFSNPIEIDVGLSRSVTDHQIEMPRFPGEGLTLLPSASILHGDGSGANKPWLQETPNPVTQIVWDSWVEINPDTAKKLGIKDRSIIQVSTPHGALEATAYYHFGIHRDAIAIPVGQGHSASGLAADNYGVNVLDLLPAKTDPSSGEFAWLSVNANVTPTTQKSYTVNVDGNARQLGREIAAATTLEALVHGSEHHETHHKRPTETYPPRKETAGYYKPYRWGMTIDADRCNGCSACVVACYAENNIPVVGKERAGLGREMSWIRLERYIEGYGDDFEVRFVPMTCQHCSNAGCETVCPVYATYHNPEGLNAQIYNRCVGTRYCSNNCAYKVRRFNFFNYEFPTPLNQQLNSTITTRSLGVMEKCSFCVQRIKEAQSDAKKLGRDVKDGEIRTACQQTCPTEAITFGNLADPKSLVSQKAKRDKESMKQRDRQHEILSELNYKPAITYLKKVNLREAKKLVEKAHS